MAEGSERRTVRYGDKVITIDERFDLLENNVLDAVKTNRKERQEQIGDITQRIERIERVLVAVVIVTGVMALVHFNELEPILDPLLKVLEHL